MIRIQQHFILLFTVALVACSGFQDSRSGGSQKNSGDLIDQGQQDQLATTNNAETGSVEKQKPRPTMPPEEEIELTHVATDVAGAFLTVPPAVVAATETQLCSLQNSLPLTTTYKEGQLALFYRRQEADGKTWLGVKETALVNGQVDLTGLTTGLCQGAFVSPKIDLKNVAEVLLPPGYNAGADSHSSNLDVPWVTAFIGGDLGLVVDFGPMKRSATFKAAYCSMKIGFGSELAVDPVYYFRRFDEFRNDDDILRYRLPDLIDPPKVTIDVGCDDHRGVYKTATLKIARDPVLANRVSGSLDALPLPLTAINASWDDALSGIAVDWLPPPGETEFLLLRRRDLPTSLIFGLNDGVSFEQLLDKDFSSGPAINQTSVFAMRTEASALQLLGDPISFLDTSVEAGQTYFYNVLVSKAVNGKRYYSLPSGQYGFAKAGTAVAQPDGGSQPDPTPEPTPTPTPDPGGNYSITFTESEFFEDEDPENAGGVKGSTFITLDGGEWSIDVVNHLQAFNLPVDIGLSFAPVSGSPSTLSMRFSGNASDHEPEDSADGQEGRKPFAGLRFLPGAFKNGGPAEAIEKLFSITFSSGNKDCAPNYVLVRMNPDFPKVTQNFCVMKYEARIDANHAAVSKPDGVLWQNATKADAWKACQGQSQPHTNYPLDNDRWQMIARQIENNDVNWYDDGEIRKLSLGNSDTGVALKASGNDKKGCFGMPGVESEFCGSTDQSYRRVHWIGTGYIWDISGNLREVIYHTSLIFPPSESGSVVSLINSDAQENFGSDPSNNRKYTPEIHDNNGLGYYTYSHDTGAEGEFLTRGGSYNSSNYAGIYSFDLVDGVLDHGGRSEHGFRCYYELGN